MLLQELLLGSSIQKINNSETQGAWELFTIVVLYPLLLIFNFNKVTSLSLLRQI
jgi:hypothetical protein